ncbi:MAG: hypothetical protein AB4290_17260 [Spirulina sp.]
MVETKTSRKVEGGRVFPEIQWSAEQKAECREKRTAFYQCCKPVFESVKAELIETHFNWYIAVEPESQEYFLAEDLLDAIALSRQKYPNSPFHLFQINQTGICGAK